MQTHYTSFGDVRDTPSSLLQKLLSIFNGTLRASACVEHQMMQGAKYIMLCPLATGEQKAASAQLLVCILPSFSGLESQECCLICFLADRLMKGGTGIKNH